MGLTRTGSKCRHKIISDMLDKVSRKRALSLPESLMLERAIEMEGKNAK